MTSKVIASGLPIVFFATALLAAVTGAALAQSGDSAIYAIDGVSVDVSAESAAQAREQALADGQLRALEALFLRLTRAIDAPRLPAVRAEDVERFVSDFEIVDERVSDVRYLATLNVRFQPDVVQDFLQRSGVPFTNKASQPVLVMPLLRQGQSVLLWEEFNTWRLTWSENARAQGLVPMVVPFGDISDISAISAESAVRGDFVPLRSLATKYGAQDSLVATATLSDSEAGGRPRVDVNLNRIGSVPQAPISFSITAGPGQTTEQLFQQAVATSIKRVEDAWVAANVVEVGPRQVLCVEARFNGIAGWVAINERIDQVPIITRTRLKKLSPGLAEVELTFGGALPQLAAALGQAGLTLSAPQQRGFSRFAARPSEPEGLHILALAGAR